MSQLDNLKSLVAELEVDAEKFFVKGNKSAGTRTRKTLQEIKKECQALRILVSETKEKTQD